MESIKENIDQVIWDYPNPFTVSIKVSNNEIDQLGHANNQVYLDWICLLYTSPSPRDS